jgi:hypothetical protein
VSSNGGDRGKRGPVSSGRSDSSTSGRLQAEGHSIQVRQRRAWPRTWARITISFGPSITGLNSSSTTRPMAAEDGPGTGRGSSSLEVGDPMALMRASAASWAGAGAAAAGADGPCLKAAAQQAADKTEVKPSVSPGASQLADGACDAPCGTSAVLQECCGPGVVSNAQGRDFLPVLLCGGNGQHLCHQGRRGVAACAARLRCSSWRLHAITVRGRGTVGQGGNLGHTCTRTAQRLHKLGRRMPV